MNIGQMPQNLIYHSMQLSQQLLQSLSILQMGAMDLHSFLLEEAYKNPLIDIDHLMQMEQSRRSSNPNTSSHIDPLEVMTPAAEPMNADLKFQFSYLADTAAERHLGHYLIDSLDENGFLSFQTLSDLRKAGIQRDFLGRAVRKLRQLEPVGIGAFSVKDCLLMQLLHSGLKGSDAWQIIRYHLPLLARNQLKQIGRKLNIPLSRVTAALQLIRKLNPHPLSYVNEGPNHLLIPDIRILKTGDHFEVEINQLPPESLKIVIENIPTDYNEILSQYLRAQIKNAKFLKNALRQRWIKLCDCAKILLDKQARFFEQGPSALVPYTRKEMAETLSVHETTIYRALHDKYVECEWGIFPTSYFFPYTFSQRSLQSITREEALTRISELIKTENHHNPLSDQQIATILSKEGIYISRRTITKYREQTNIPSSPMRRLYK